MPGRPLYIRDASEVSFRIRQAEEERLLTLTLKRRCEFATYASVLKTNLGCSVYAHPCETRTGSFEQCAQFDQPAKEIGSSKVGSAEVPGLSLLAAEQLIDWGCPIDRAGTDHPLVTSWKLSR